MKELRNRQLPSQPQNSDENEMENVVEQSEGEEIQVLNQENESGHEISSPSVQKEETSEIIKCMTVMQQQMMTQMNAMQRMMQTMMPQSQMHHDGYMNPEEHIPYRYRQPISEPQSYFVNDKNANSQDHLICGNTQRFEYGHGDIGQVRRNNRSSLEENNETYHPDEPKARLPIFNGRNSTTWEPFWIQFRMISERFKWSTHRQTEELFFCLKDEALVFASQLSLDVRTDLFQLYSAMKQRFGDHTLPETYRLQLQNIRRKSEEPIQEFSSRINSLMNKAYPGLANEQLKTELAIGHLLNGLDDQSIAYDVATKRPKTVQSAVDMISWHECCKNGMRKRANIRQVICEDDNQDEPLNDVTICQVKSQKAVTEERLNQFGSSLRDSIVQCVKDLIEGQNKEGHNQQPKSNGGQRNFVCYECNEEGHTKRHCPLLRQRDQHRTSRQQTGERRPPFQKTQTSNVDRVDVNSQSLNFNGLIQ